MAAKTKTCQIRSSSVFRPARRAQVRVSSYFIELYLDNLRDLLWAVEHTKGTPPKLEVHMDQNKMVVVKNVVTKVCMWV